MVDTDTDTDTAADTDTDTAADGAGRSEVSALRSWYLTLPALPLFAVTVAGALAGGGLLHIATRLPNALGRPRRRGAGDAVRVGDDRLHVGAVA